MRQWWIISLLICQPAFAGIDFSMNSKLGFGESRTSKEFYAGYALPEFKSPEEAKLWATKTPYAVQWENLLKKKTVALWKQAGDVYEAPYNINKQAMEANSELIRQAKEKMVLMDIYFRAYVLMLDKADKAQVGATVYSYSIPCGKQGCK